MVLLVIELEDFMETDGHSDFSSCVRAGHPQGSAKFSRALLHYRDSEVPEPETCVLRLKTAAIVANDKAEKFAFVAYLDADFGCLRMTKGIRHCLLADADEVMNRPRSDRDFISLDIKSQFDAFAGAA